CLSEIVDSTGQPLLRVDYSNPSLIKIHLHPQAGPDGSPLATYQLHLTDREMRVIQLPTEDKASWRLSYENSPATQHMTCLKTIETPTGSRETLTYDDAGHRLPNGAPVQRLPRIDTHEFDPGFGQPVMKTQYTYSAENFMGANGDLTWSEGEDNLYNAPADYVYTVTANEYDGAEVRRKTHYQYNRHHLLTLQTTERYGEVLQFDDQGDDDGTVKMDWHVHKIHTVHHELPGVPFDLQPAYFQMTKTITQSWEMSSTDDNRYREEVTTTNFDDFGNQIEERQANGIRVVNEYYPVQGEEGGCPPDPHGFTRTLKRTTTYPYDGPDVEGEAQVVSQLYRYQLADGLNDTNRPAQIACQWLQVRSEELYQGTGEDAVLLKKTSKGYLNLPDNAYLHGRPDYEEETLYDAKADARRPGAWQPHTSRTQWRYTQAYKNKTRVGHQVKETLIGHDLTQISFMTQLDPYTGQTLVGQDLNGVITHYEYDALLRLKSVTVAPDTDYASQELYSYQLVATHGGQATQTTIAETGVVTLDKFDGANRLIERFIRVHDPQSGALQPARLIHEASYDSMGQLIVQTGHDYHPRFSSGRLSLTERFEYSAWGGVCKTFNADGTQVHTIYSPFGEQGDVTASWLSTPDAPARRLNQQMTLNNRFDQPRETSRLDEHGARLGSSGLFYDGLGRCVRKEDRFNDPSATRAEIKRTERYAYDAFGRITRTTRPNDSALSRTFANHFTGELTRELRAHRAGNDPTGTLVCDRTYDGIGRISTLSHGPRQESYLYKDELMLLSKRTTAGNRVFDYEYLVALTTSPQVIRAADGKLSSHFTYDSKTAEVLSAQNEEGRRSYTYTDLGYLRSEAWSEAGPGSDASLGSLYETSLMGRAMQRTDAYDGHSEQTEHGYDDLGRLSWTTQGNLRADFIYNSAGYLLSVRTQDKAQDRSLLCEQSYDSVGREQRRTITVYAGDAAITTQAIVNVWRDDDLLHSRTLLIDDAQQLQELFDYDPLSRLVSYTCEGEPDALPRDGLGNAIMLQTFDFDELDNLTFCYTLFADGTKNRATYNCEGFQLKEVVNTHPDYPARQSFSYDDDGNMLNDEHGRRLDYDEHGRLIAVRSPDGLETLFSYRYDGHDHLLGARQGDNQEVKRRYQGERLVATTQGNTLTQYLYDGERPLGLQQQGDSGANRLLLTGISNSVLGESSQDGVHRITYNAYGESSEAETLTGLLGFNGEARERALGWYLLGRGYRAYNPGLMRFHSPDSLLPEEAGINPYQYCLGNPVVWRDPTGHATRGYEGPGQHHRVREGASNTAQWIILGVTAAIAVVSIAGFGAYAAGAVTAVGAGIALTTMTKVGLVVGSVGVAMQTVGLGLQGAAIIEKNPKKSAFDSMLAWVFNTVGGFMTAGGVAMARSGLITSTINAGEPGLVAVSAHRLLNSLIGSNVRAANAAVPQMAAGPAGPAGTASTASTASTAGTSATQTSEPALTSLSTPTQTTEIPVNSQQVQTVNNQKLPAGTQTPGEGLGRKIPRAKLLRVKSVQETDPSPSVAAPQAKVASTGGAPASNDKGGVQLYSSGQFNRGFGRFFWLAHNS
ncbi:RHS repeat domain-containing protein, partial [Pseudomonas promysalinigenes]